MRGERGAALLEVLVSAVVLFIATSATLLVLDGSSRTSAANRDRLTAANLAEADQERMRGLSLRTLDGYSTTRTVFAGGEGEAFRVDSSTRWVNDVAGFTPTCTSGTEGTSDYLLLTTTVRRVSTTTGSQAQTVRSLLAPKVSTVGYKGTLSVPFEDRNGAALAGVTTTLSGRTTGTATSNSSGCAVFSYFPAGTYTAAYSRTGYVSPAGETAVSVSGVVTTGQTNFTPAQRYDRKASVTANAVTRKAADGPLVPAATRAVTLANPGVGNATGARIFTASGTAPAATVAGTELFPFKDGYAAYAGNCGTNDPTRYGETATTVAVAPAGTSAVNVFVPTVVLSGPAGFRGSRVTFTLRDASCGAQVHVFDAQSQSQLEAQVPYGDYDLCAQGTSGGATVIARKVVQVRRGPQTVTFENATLGGSGC